MKISTKRMLVAAAFFAIVVAGLFIDAGLGTPCSFGWDFVASVCPVGVISAFVAGRSVPVTGIICLAITVVLALIVGRAFCGWLCPVPLERRLFGGRRAADRSANVASCMGQMADAGFKMPDHVRHANRGDGRSSRTSERAAAEVDYTDEYYGESPIAVGERAAARAARIDAARTEIDYVGEYRDLPLWPDCTAGGRVGKNARRSAHGGEGCGVADNGRCAIAHPRDAETLARAQLTEPGRRADGSSRIRIRSNKFDIRLAVLAVALLCTLVFGFPVFCLVCPVGLTFATLVMIAQVIQAGAFTWGVVIFPAIIALELTLLRRWCHTICPIGALLALVARGNRTLRPTVDPATCVESVHGTHCSACYHACPEGIDLHRPAQSVHFSECTKCAECVFACPVDAISMPFLPRDSR